MKRLAIPLVILALGLGLVPTGYAGTGEAYVNYWHVYRSGSYDFYTHVLVTNISDETVTVTLRFYDKDGTLVTSPDFVYDEFLTSTNFSTALTAATAQFDLGPRRTCRVKIRRNGDIALRCGFGTIQWNSAGTSDVALLAHAEFLISTLAWACADINRGEPF